VKIEKEFKKKEKEKGQLYQLIQDVLDQFKPDYRYKMNFRMDQMKRLIDNMAIPKIIQKNLLALDLFNIKGELAQIQNILQSKPLNSIEYQKLANLLKGIVKYFQIEQSAIASTKSEKKAGGLPKSPKVVSKKFDGAKERESPGTKLKNWDNPPELLKMTEEQGKGLTGGGTFAGAGITIGTLQFLKSLKLHKCHKCKSDSYALFIEDPDKEIIYCTKCGQKYKVLQPNGKIWSSK
jgi:hypothetical protein